MSAPVKLPYRTRLILLLFAGIALSACSSARQERRVLDAFYSATDAGRVEDALSLTAPTLRLDAWAQAINGNHLGTHHLAGWSEVRQALADPTLSRGLRRNFYGAQGPLYRLRNIIVDGTALSFELVPDRRSPGGRPYNSYRGSFTFVGDRIESITMIEVIGWL